VERQQRLKFAAGAAGAEVVASQLFDQVFVSAHDALATLHFGFGRESLSPFAAALKSSSFPQKICFA
jgi:hypothetical protein